MAKWPGPAEHHSGARWHPHPGASKQVGRLEIKDSIARRDLTEDGKVNLPKGFLFFPEIWNPEGICISYMKHMWRSC